MESCHLQLGQFAYDVCMHEFVYQPKFGAEAFYLVLSAYCLVGVWQESTLLSLMPITMIYILGQTTPTSFDVSGSDTPS